MTELPTTPPPGVTTPPGEPSPRHQDSPPADSPPAHSPPADSPTSDSPTSPRSPADRGPTLLPDISWDETDEGWSERAEPSDDDRIRGEVPPHHVG